MTWLSDDLCASAEVRITINDVRLLAVLSKPLHAEVAKKRWASDSSAMFQRGSKSRAELVAI